MIIDAINSVIKSSQSLTSITILAPAKINIGLRILDKRSDGYHNLISIMQRISLCDLIQISTVDDFEESAAQISQRNKGIRQFRIEYEGPELTADPADNLCIRAAIAFRAHFEDKLPVRIKLEKHIPVGAGLGGGSSDAASVLLGLAKLFNISAKNPELIGIAGKIGSDVSFFMNQNSASLVQGVGDQLSYVRGLDEDLSVIVIFPDFAISTTWAYRTLDQSLTFDKINIKLLTRDFLAYNGGIPTGEMGNDFEVPVFATYPILKFACQKLKQAGAKFTGLSGSGSALFGVFRKRNTDKALALEWPDSWSCFICRPL